MLRNRKGVTLLEMMTVMILGAAMVAIAIPQVRESRRAAQMATARTQLESYLATARAIAVRNGGRTQVVRSGNTLTIQADTGTGYVNMAQPLEIDPSSNIALDGPTTPILFDARGLASSLNASGAKFVLTVASGYGAGTKDSLCLTRFGAALDKKCGQAPPTTAPSDTGILLDPDVILTPLPTLTH